MLLLIDFVYFCLTLAFQGRNQNICSVMSKHNWILLNTCVREQPAAGLPIHIMLVHSMCTEVNPSGKAKPSLHWMATVAPSVTLSLVGVAFSIGAILGHRSIQPTLHSHNPT